MDTALFIILIILSGWAVCLLIEIRNIFKKDK